MMVVLKEDAYPESELIIFEAFEARRQIAVREVWIQDPNFTTCTPELITLASTSTSSLSDLGPRLYCYIDRNAEFSLRGDIESRFSSSSFSGYFTSLRLRDAPFDHPEYLY